MRLIDADALLEDIGEEPMNWTNSPEEIQEYSDWKRTVAIINSAPTIDAEPVRHGHWVDKGIVAIEFIRERHEYECSRCGKAVHLLENEKPYYCDNCGAKMDEVSE